MVHDQTMNASVVELLPVAVAAAAEDEVLGDEALRILRDGPLTLVRVSARGERRIESG